VNTSTTGIDWVGAIRFSDAHAVVRSIEQDATSPKAAVSVAGHRSDEHDLGGELHVNMSSSLSIGEALDAVVAVTEDNLSSEVGRGERKPADVQVIAFLRERQSRHRWRGLYEGRSTHRHEIAAVGKYRRITDVRVALTARTVALGM
jgi:hypothetical protein